MDRSGGGKQTNKQKNIYDYFILGHFKNYTFSTYVKQPSLVSTIPALGTWDTKTFQMVQVRILKFILPGLQQRGPIVLGGILEKYIKKYQRNLISIQK